MTSRLETANSGATQSILVAPAKIDCLPQELINQIFSNLSRSDLQTAVSVNQWMKESVIAAANFNEPASIKEFVQHLIRNLNIEPFPAQRNLLIGILQNITPQNFVELRSLKGYILDVKDQLINIIKTLDVEMANSLMAHIQPPNFMEDIFKLSAIERRIDKANLIPDEEERELALWDICEALAQSGKIDKAIEVAMTIPSKLIREIVLRFICKALAQDGKIDRAIEVAMMIPSENEKGLALWDISQALEQGDNIGRAIEVARMIPNEEDRETALRCIAANTQRQPSCCWTV